MIAVTASEQNNQAVSVSLEEAQAIRLFSGMSPENINRILPRLERSAYAPGDIIMSRTLSAEYLYFVLSGRVRVEFRDTNGQIFNLAEMGPGELFGERAILTNEPRTADVRAIDMVQTAKLSRSDFEELLHETPLLYANLCRDLSRQLGTWAQRHQREERENRDIITSVIGWQLLPEFEAFPGNSSWVRELNQLLEQLGRSSEHVVITGEPGTWKDLAARLIHFHGDATRPVLFLDCASPPPVAGEVDKAGSSSELLLEIRQEASLFGHAPDSSVYARRVRRGMLELASGGDMILRNIDCLTSAMQERLVAFMDTGQFRRRGESEWRRGLVRIVATSGENLEESVAAGNFSSALFDRLKGASIVMAPLRERKKDIPVIARSLLRTLNAKHHKNVRRLSQEALNRLVDHSWPLNGSELYQVLSRAVIVCNGDEIDAEQIFLQGQTFSSGRFNLLSIPALEHLARRPNFPRLLSWTTVPLFMLVMLYTLAGPPFDNAANLAVWTLWWPALLITGFLFARGWCSYCPLEAIGAFVGAKKAVVHEPGRLLRAWGPTFSLAGMVVIILLEQATGMFSWSFATGVLLLGLLTATASSDLLLGRRGWCKYLCPLGRIVSLMSRISILEMHSNRNVCISRCRVDECVKEKGCPMGLHPTGISNSDHCVLCLDCVRNCPHHAMQLDLRIPVQGIYTQSRRSFHEALFSVTLVGVIIAAKATPLLYGHQPEVFPHRLWSVSEFFAGVLIAGTFALLTMLISIGSGKGRWRELFSICGLAYLPLAVSGLFVIYFRAFVEGGARLVPMLLHSTVLDQWLDSERLTPDLGTLRLLIYPLIVAGAFFSWVVLRRLKREQFGGHSGMYGHFVLVIGAAAAFIFLL